MKLLQILYSGLGGHGSVAFSLIDANKYDDWKPMMCFLGIEPMSDIYVTQCKDKNIDYVHIQSTAGQPWKSWKQLYKLLKIKEPDAIILHCISALPPCWCYARYKNIPLIAVEHTPNNIKRKSEWIASMLTMQLADAVVLLTSSYQEELKQKLGWFYRNRKVSIIPNGINTDRFALSCRTLQTEKKIIRLGMAARFSDKKRQDLLIEMLLFLKQHSDGINYQLTLAGNGNTKKALQQKVKEVGLDNSVIFAGHLSEGEMIEWFQSIDIYLHASEGETLSTSLLQAMSTGLPIIASNVSGITNLLNEEKEYGILVDNTGKSFADAVIKLINDIQKARELSLLVRKLAVTKYSQDRMFELYNKIIKEIRK